MAAGNEYYMMRDKNYREIGQTQTASTYLETAAHVCQLLMHIHIACRYVYAKLSLILVNYKTKDFFFFFETPQNQGYYIFPLLNTVNFLFCVVFFLIFLFKRFV